MLTVEQRILQLWKQGWTSGDIAKQLNLTRNAVMGKLHRFRQAGVIDYKSKKARDAALTAMARSKNKKQQIADGADLSNIEIELPLFDYMEAHHEPPPKERKPATLLELQFDSCRYSVSGKNTKEYLFCNKVQKQNSSYCEEHHSLCYMPYSKDRVKKDHNYEQRYIR